MPPKKSKPVRQTSVRERPEAELQETTEADPLTLESLRMATIAETAEVARVSRTTIWNWINGGVLRSVKVQGRRLIPLSELSRLLGFQAK